MSPQHPKKKSLLLYQKYALLTLLCVYLVVALLGVYEAASTGGSALFFLLSHFMVIKSENPLIYWIHLTMGFIIVGMLLSAIPRLYKQIQRLKVKP